MTYIYTHIYIYIYIYIYIWCLEIVIYEDLSLMFIIESVTLIIGEGIDSPGQLTRELSKIN